jgi:hypothetical protein
VWPGAVDEWGFVLPSKNDSGFKLLFFGIEFVMPSATQSPQELAYQKLDARSGLAAYLREVVVSDSFTEYEFDAFWTFIRDKRGLWFMEALDLFIVGTPATTYFAG